MSEKRFELDYDDEDCACISNFVNNGEKLTDREVVDLLNKLYEENEQLKKECKIAIDEMITDYKNLEKENEELKEDKKILDSIKKKHNCSNCVKTIENNNYSYCLKYYKEVTEDEICENYRYWR